MNKKQTNLDVHVFDAAGLGQKRIILAPGSLRELWRLPAENLSELKFARYFSLLKSNCLLFNFCEKRLAPLISYSILIAF